MEQSEQLQSEREDSTVTIFRLREELGEEIQTLVDKQEEQSKIAEEIDAIKTVIRNKEAQLEQLEEQHAINFKETI